MHIYHNFCRVIFNGFQSHKLVAFWGEGTQTNSPVPRNPQAGVAFRGRSYRLNGSQSSSRAASEAETNTNPQQQPNAAAAEGRVAFRGRSYRLDGR